MPLLPISKFVLYFISLLLTSLCFRSFLEDSAHFCSLHLHHPFWPTLPKIVPDCSSNLMFYQRVATIHKSRVCGSVGRAVASSTRGPQFDTSHLQTLYYLFLSTAFKNENKEKRPGKGQIKKVQANFTYR